MSSFTESGDDTVPVTGSYHDDAFVGYNSGAASQGFDSFPADSDSVTDSPIFNNSSYAAGDDVFVSHQASEVPSSPQIYGSDEGFLPEENGKGLDGGYGGVDGPILPDMGEMQREEGFALREWRRQNAIRMEEKEKQEKELLSQIIDEADEYKVEFYRKRTIACESNKATNREKEKLFVASLEKFHAEADKNYWKSIADLIPNEVAAIEKKRGKKDQEKKPSVVVVHGPKPGKPTDLSRMRQILLKLKHSAPDHLKFTPPPQAPPASETDAKTASSNVPPPAPVVAQHEVVAAA